jgi:hypothetical protein
MSIFTGHCANQLQRELLCLALDAWRLSTAPLYTIQRLDRQRTATASTSYRGNNSRQATTHKIAGNTARRSDRSPDVFSFMAGIADSIMELKAIQYKQQMPRRLTRQGMQR